MKRITYAAAISLALTLTASAASMDHVTVGCADYKDYKALIRLRVENDKEAFKSYALSYDCSVFPKDAAVIISDHGVLSSCVRQRGNPTCYWVTKKQSTSVTEKERSRLIIRMTV